MRLTGALAAAAGSQPDTVNDSCHAARKLASAYLNGDLDEHQIQQVDDHLGTCACCPPVLQALQGVVAALASEPRTAPVEGLLDALRAEIAQARRTGT